MYNRVILMGRLTRDPELRTTQGGVTMCRFSIAVDRRFVKQGEERQADFFDITCWRQTAEFVCKYFTKGRAILVEGTLQNNNYTDNNGVKHYSTAIIADQVNFCGDKRSDSGGGMQPYNQQYDPQPRRQPAPQQPSAPRQAPPAQQFDQAPEAIATGGFEDFEEIMSDGNVPF